ncbi:hypothetical protein D9758_017475 [Tetrapyrgos nigripes]|uniref:Uncharacterized protein n=1 Tax=Tetrapyrgos nigripes TaxID=182062 RepID=A0A8H5C384_9AGAR|nr:hypothetical protein D9758_017475 [Tetrapyrgos nigripes]
MGFHAKDMGGHILLVTVVLANGAIAEISEISGIHSSSPSLALTTSLRFHTHLVPTSIATQTMKAYQQFALSPNLTNHIGTDFEVLKQVSERGVSGLPEPGTGTTLVTGSYINMLGAEVPLTDEAMGAMMEYLGTVGWDSELLYPVEVELYSAVNSAINALPLDDTAFAHRNTLWTFQPYASSLNSLLPYPEEGFVFMDGIVRSIVDNMPPG